MRQDPRQGTPPAPAAAQALSAPALSGIAEPASPPPGPPGASTGTLDVPDGDRYERRHVLGVGGMGRVQVMFDRRLGREVAHKEIAAPALTPGTTTALEARLAREAAITSRLEHPAIVPLYDAGRGPDGRIFYTMRIVRGRSLADAVATSPTAAERVRLLRHVRDACEAVAFAHRRGVLHRDLKPANIMVGGFGETQVVDWGLAREVDTAESANPADANPADDGLTNAGVVVGTPQYLSPEQAAGAPASTRSDVWSLGLVLAEVLGGRRIFDSPSASEALARIRSGAPDLSVLLRHHPPELVAIARRATAHAPAERYSDAKAMADDLTAWLEGRRVSAHAYRPAELLGRLVRAWRFPLAVLAVALLAIVVVVAVAFTETAAERTRAEDALATAEAERTRSEEAEATATAALEEAERALGQVLLAEARTQLRRDARGEAEVLAARVLEAGPDPDALGVLLMTRATAAPVPFQEGPLPLCAESVLTADGEGFACRGGAAVSFWQVEPLSRRWEVPATGDSLFVLETPRRVGLAHPRGAVLFDATDGARLPAPDAFTYHRFIAETPLGTAAIATTGVPLRVGADGRVEDRRPACDGGDAARLGLGDDEGRHAIICARPLPSDLAQPGGPLLRTATVHLFGPGEAETKVTLDALALGAAPGSIPAAADWAPARGALLAHGSLLLIASEAGRVALVELTTGRTRYARHLGEGHVAALAVSADEEVAAIADAAGGPRLLAVASGQWLGRLPGGPVQGMRFLRTGPKRLATWRPGGADARLTVVDLPAPRPSQVELSGGVSALEVAGDDVVVAGTGYVEVLDEALRMRARSPWPAVVKDVGVRGDGAAVAVVGQGVDALRSFALPTLATMATAETAHTHRRVVWTRAGVLAAPYAGGLLLWRPGEAPTDLLPGTTLSELDGEPGAAFAVALTEANRALLRIDLRAAPIITTIPTDASACHSARISADGARIACLQRDRFAIYKNDGTALGEVLPEAGAPLTAMALDAGWQRVFLGDLDGRVHIHALPGGARLARAMAHDERISALALRGSGDTAELLSAGWDRRLVRHALGPLDAAPVTLIEGAAGRWRLRLEDVLSLPGRDVR